jgi:hypothetical protein
MLPAVETAKSRPAVLPRLVSDRARRRTAIGVAVARTMLGSAKRAIVATSGFQRGPGSQRTTCSSTQSSMTGIKRIRPAPTLSAPSRRSGVGNRSAVTPPTQYPTESPARTTPMSAPQTKIELPKNGATTRLATSSSPSSTAPEMNTAEKMPAAERSIRIRPL